METFVGDSITITLRTDVSLVGHTELLIKYKKPDGSSGNWIAGVVPGVPTSMQYATSTIILDQHGTWKLQAFVAFGNRRLHGKWVDMIVLDPLH